MSTLGALKTRVLQNIGDTLVRFGAEVQEAIVDAIAHYRSERFYFTEDYHQTSTTITSATADGTEYYAYPTSPKLISIDTLRVAANSDEPYTLLKAAWSVLDDWSTSPSPTAHKAPPSFFATRGGAYVRLYPIPDGIYTLYWTGLVEMSTEITTSSADSATNSWTSEVLAAALIRERATAAMKQDIMQNPEDLLLLTPSDRRAGFLSTREVDAYWALKRETRQRAGRSANVPHGPGVRYRGRS